MNREECARQREVHCRVATLTPRERRAMQWIVAGDPNKLIARRLGVSHRTVDRLRAAVFRKMGVETAVELARLIGEWRAPCEAPSESARTCSEPTLDEVVVKAPHAPFGATNPLSQPPA
jgi:DNA-binding CsgD family transcriptional regulator